LWLRHLAGAILSAILSAAVTTIALVFIIAEKLE
jgi:hypothetical protein